MLPAMTASVSPLPLPAAIESTLVPPTATVVEAMRVMDTSALGIVLMVDAEMRLLGTITDGDIRRALLKGAAPESPMRPHVRENFVAVSPAAGRAEVLDLMQARYIQQVPVVEEGRLVGLHLLRELLGGVVRPNVAVIMAGGKGMRLRPITETIPKPMVKVAGRPILERLVLHLVGFGIRRIYLAINYLGHIVRDCFGDGARFGCRIEYLEETDELGTGGALSLLPEPPRDPVLVLNGDLVTQMNVHLFLEAHQRLGVRATMAVRRYFHAMPFGCVEVREERVTRLVEKPVLEKMINAGAYVLEPALVGRVPRAPFPITRLFEECLQRGEPVGAWEIQEDWIDVGQKEQLQQAQEGSV